LGRLSLFFLELHLKQQWVIPPPRDLDVPLVCLDETSKQLLANTRAPIPMKPGQRERRDYEYQRNGTARSSQ
jgi:hypothetical protein